MDQQEINKLVNKVIKIITDRNEFLKEGKAFVIDLEDRFCFYVENTKEIYTGKSILHKHKSLANETLRSNQIFNYTIGATSENGNINYILHKDRTITDLQNLYNEIVERY